MAAEIKRLTEIHKKVAFSWNMEQISRGKVKSEKKKINSYRLHQKKTTSGLLGSYIPVHESVQNSLLSHLQSNTYFPTFPS